MKKFILYIFLTVALTVTLSASVAAATKDAEDTVYNSMLSSIDEIDLSAYSISTDELAEIFNDLMNTRPDLFFVEPSYTYTYTDEGIVLTMLPKYKYTGDTLSSAQNEYDSFIGGIIDGIDPEWSDVQKLLYVHDYLILHTEYDTTLTNSDVYMLARKKTGTCVSYTLAFIAVCNELGIECDVAASDTMDHIWNVVKLDDEWYHIDITWDDTTPDIDGRALHSCFLRSDEAIVESSSEKHENWMCEYECTSTKYDSAFWANVTSPFVCTSGSWYAFESVEFTLYEYNFLTETATALLTVDEQWRVPDSSDLHYVLAYSGVGAYDDFIYFNSPNSIYSYNIKTGYSGVIHAPMMDDGKSIYYFTIDDGVLTYNITSSPTDTSIKTGLLDLQSGMTVYSVTYMAGGDVYDIQYYSLGETIKPPKAPSDGFLSWDSVPKVMPNESITVTAIYTNESCTHESVDFVTVTPPTCTEAGLGNVICSYCGDVISSTKLEPEHTPGEWITLTEATCTSNGILRMSCSICGKMIDEQSIPAVSHEFGEWIDSEKGVRERTCSLCGHKETEIFPADSIVTEEITDSVSSDENTSPDISDSDGDRELNKAAAVYTIVVVFSAIIIGGLIYLIIARRLKK